MNYRVSKTIDNRVLVEEPARGFLASLINSKWVFLNMFGQSDSLTEILDPTEAARYYESAKVACKAEPGTGSASDFTDSRTVSSALTCPCLIALKI